MLPPTPLHLLLFDEVVARGIGALVMTSGNVADEPICIGNDEALEHLRGIADRWLLHDRPIARRADDSVVQVARSRAVARTPQPRLRAGAAARRSATGWRGAGRGRRPEEHRLPAEGRTGLPQPACRRTG
jgi:hypothetical protein